MLGTWLLVGVGGFLGAVARFTLHDLTHRALGDRFPYGTLAVNLIGCLLVGVLMHFVDDRPKLPEWARLVLVAGALGSLTTFSAFGHDTLGLLRDHKPGLALVNVGASVLLGLVAVWIGWKLASGLPLASPPALPPE